MTTKIGCMKNFSKTQWHMNLLFCSVCNMKQASPPAQQVAEVKTRRHGLLPSTRQTNPFIWCGAILGVILSLILIITGIIILIFFLFVKPKNPVFDIPSASLNTIVLDSPFYLNADLTFLANFSNPNHKMDALFEYVNIDLYFQNRIIAAQALPPFAERRGEAKFGSIHMISSEVYLPPEISMELQKQMRNNSIMFNIRGAFRVRVSFGIGHYTYWLYGRCQIELTNPPTGVLISKICRTKK
ncbi:hypothetical protein J5N97_026424 [Dioscorea zingiberensis]|uniref:Late embryogenesis abundant protein LEA-2 subgroup domain-containing protein n=1 Tax=Dioscorea zingiberensis TaxID=325984 RepID=A0A9D5C226_9LILI|nr:hypothetical protein J5N97_026424 [Dioscorea zingiberensis]